MAIEVGGRYVERTELIRSHASRWRLKAARWKLPDPAIPLCAIVQVHPGEAAERENVQLLCALLAEVPALRPRLTDPGRAERLVEDLQTDRFRPGPYRMGTMRETTEILVALRLAGYEHRLGGRPLPGESLPSAEEIVPRVIERISANPYAQGVRVDRQHVRDVVLKNYLDVDPWPIRALTDPVDPLRPPHTSEGRR
ncbi:MAG: hypothetical protein LC722_01800 [Actinobacteria bacterium]|nr:hypothetical protein [Actinomycetota bacterium]